MRHLFTLSATALARRVRAREISAHELLEAHITALRRVNPRLNAVVAFRFDAAREQARRLDVQLAAGEVDESQPFLGVPCTIKEAFALEGMPNSAGLLARRGLRATEDAPAVARLRAAGAIPLGVTNLSELCMWMESDNLVYGRTNNPYDLRCTAGGSSGGEGSIVGSGVSPFGLGADVGGSIRMPAFFNGVFGHKATPGLVPNAGQFPVASTPRGQSMLATGPLCRRAQDLEPLLDVLADRRPDEHPRASSVSIASLRVLDVPSDGRWRVESELAEAQRRAAAQLASRGARVERRYFPAFRHALLIWAAAMEEASPEKFAELMGQGHAIAPGRELWRWASGRSNHTLPAIGLACVEQLLDRLPGDIGRYRELGDQLREEIIDALGARGVLLYPPYPSVAPRHGEPLRPPLRFTYTALWNALGLPVTQVPLGLDARGLPLGVQVVTAPGRDHIAIAVALELERAFGGWRPPREG
ncbi:MAG: amidase [Deltaproteobacteria bacterium]|nr:amidase [Deltaproteobacteria bacterium]